MKGGCLCGAVRYEITAAPLTVANCHCSMCRRHSGAAFLTYAAFPRDKVIFTGEIPKLYRSSPEAERGHCASCGSPLIFVFDADQDTIWIAVGSIAKADQLVPQEHWYVADKLSWVALDDGLKQWPGAPGTTAVTQILGETVKRSPK